MMSSARKCRGLRAKQALILALPLAGFATFAPSGAVPVAGADPPPVVDAFRELMLVDPRVMNPHQNGMRSHNGGPNTSAGPWSFRGLVEDIGRQMNGGVALSQTALDEFMEGFLGSWLNDYSMSAGVVSKLDGNYDPDDVELAARDVAKVEQALLEDRGDGFVKLVSGPNGTSRTYELWRAPFELIAIANRGDLGAGDGSHAGELRFVFALKGQPEFTMILEYQVPTDVWNAPRFAREWHRLGTLTVGSKSYLEQLELITSRVTKWQPPPSAYAQAAMPRRLAHVRTNELAFAPESPPAAHRWELREFRQNPAGALVPATVFNTPNHTQIVDEAADPNDTDVLAQFVHCYAGELLDTSGSGTGFDIPATFDSCPADPGLSITPLDMFGTHATAGDAWTTTVSGVDATALQNFGMLTCNGCHQDNRNPNGMPFLHVNPVSRTNNGFELMTGRGRLSLFLSLHHDASGNPIPDAACDAPGATCFELERRKEKLGVLLAQAEADQCTPSAQCGSGQYCVAGECEATPAHCHNYRIDSVAGETGPDCGGGACADCGLGYGCLDTSDCEAGTACVAGVCTET